MPIDPGTPRWLLPVPGPGLGDMIAIGGDLEPATLLSAYRGGLFPMPYDAIDAGSLDAGNVIGWWSPVYRGVLPIDGLRVSRSLRKSVRRYEVTVDTAFDEVVAGCADPGRDGGWINRRIQAAYGQLHTMGWAHSVETWLDGELVGGLYGVAIGGLFAGESMFSRATDASKVALVHLVSLLDDEHAAQRVLDTQWQTDHLESLGVVEVTRESYLEQIAAAVLLPLPAAFDQ
ncbi:MAG: leucyl/phenylalanyl-tRNA--protein transferase [Marmoricola sp.]